MNVLRGRGNVKTFHSLLVNLVNPDEDLLNLKRLEVLMLTLLRNNFRNFPAGRK